ncbi:MAG: DNA polymerase III subunit gamma/tau [Firmicutes bacterium HGW-Firmicutes-1]|jgi:DNA polymerase-3 subunit gamma/tau|nr:MAG: DNA polymerase III subunit gamma/tau [Firmicutes bacterium HGW-Firmicutes-1]
MAYTALYRKWRPDCFENVVGQEHIVKTLTNQIKAGRIGHAYLFCGTRGTGKTSTAKIFAKAVNCEAPVEGSPCNHCPVCENLSFNQSMNIIEIDAASNNGVDNIREIREEVRYTPTEGKYKVYIVDEVHMLSQGAFNALLKTLEEPPSHVIFILATTEPHKIPATILSRCQRYDFKRISVITVAKTIMRYLEEEGIVAEEAAIRYIAKVADGSMRDALSILDQCIAFYLGEEITFSKVLDVLGAVDTSVFTKLVSALEEKDVKKCMDIMELVFVQGRDLPQFVIDLIHYFRNLIVFKSIGDSEGIVEMSDENFAVLKQQSHSLKDDIIIYYIKVFSELESKMKQASQKRVLIEVELMKLCQPSTESSLTGIMDRLSHLEKLVKEGNIVTKVVEKQAEIPEPKVAKKTIHKDAIPTDVKEAMIRFDELVARTTGLERAILTRAIPAYLEDEYLYIICEDEIQKNRLILPEITSTINEILGSLHQKRFKLKIMTVQEYDTLAHATKDITTAAKDAKNLFEELKSQIKFEIQEI